MINLVSIEKTISLDIKEASDNYERMKNQTHTIAAIAEVLLDCLLNKGIIYLCGNGGSAADCQHIAAEFTGRFLKERKSLPSIALTTNTSVLTAIGNDYGYDNVFARQVAGLMTKDDCLIGISTSGKSKNITLAFEEAKTIGARTIAFTGDNPSPLSEIADYAYKSPSKNTPRIQECHILCLHTICNAIEQGLFK